MTDWSDCLTEGGRALAPVVSQSKTTLIAVHPRGICKGRGTRGRELIYGGPPHGKAVTVAGTAVCPVCACPETNGDHCARPLCFWRMTEREEWGEWTDRELKTFDEELEHERHRWDVRAALRAATDGGALPTQWVRGEPPTPDESRELSAKVDAEAPPGAGPAEKALARLVKEDLRAVVFLVVDPEGISRHLVTTDDIGTPRVRDRRRAIPWSEHVPELRGKVPDHQRFLLAGGHGAQPLDWGALVESLAKTELRQWGVVERRGIVEPSETVVLWRMVDWSVPALAVQEVRKKATALFEQPVADATDSAAEVVDKVLRQAPLCHPYSLAYVEVDPDTGEVSPPKIFPLFSRDARAGAEVTLTVTLPRIAPDRLLLPVVATPGEERSDWCTVRVGKLNLEGSDPITVTVRLDQPGHVSFISPEGITSNTTQWHEIEESIPSHADGRPVDLVCAVELGGATTGVDQRIGITTQIITDFKDRYIGTTALQVGLLGYGDHDDDAGSLDLVNHPLGPPVTALNELKRWSPRAYRNDLGAPLEDALKALTDVEWREDSHRVLLIVASRPPHPPAQRVDRGRNVCPRGLDWSVLHAEARDEHKVTFVVVRQDPEHPWPHGTEVERQLKQRADDEWQRLGYTVPFDDAKLKEQVWSAAGVPADGGPDILKIPISVRLATS